MSQYLASLNGGCCHHLITTLSSSSPQVVVFSLILTLSSKGKGALGWADWLGDTTQGYPTLKGLSTNCTLLCGGPVVVSRV